MNWQYITCEMAVYYLGIGSILPEIGSILPGGRARGWTKSPGGGQSASRSPALGTRLEQLTKHGIPWYKIHRSRPLSVTNERKTVNCTGPANVLVC